MTKKSCVRYKAASISTHTLTWSVTFRAKNYYGMTDISTHTLTWSVTLTKINPSISFLYFNSHAHVERDLTPARYFCFSADFNSHAHVERDNGDIGAVFGDYNFNSHAHVERDCI